MAATTVVGDGLVIDGDIGEATASDEPETLCEELARACITQLRQGHPKAALDAARELARTIVLENQL